MFGLNTTNMNGVGVIGPDSAWPLHWTGLLFGCRLIA
jgi:hypothetical protein